VPRATPEQTHGVAGRIEDVNDLPNLDGQAQQFEWGALAIGCEGLRPATPAVLRSKARSFILTILCVFEILQGQCKPLQCLKGITRKCPVGSGHWVYPSVQRQLDSAENYFCGRTVERFETKQKKRNTFASARNPNAGESWDVVRERLRDKLRKLSMLSITSSIAFVKPRCLESTI
jgi:hypothetical protein